MGTDPYDNTPLGYKGIAAVTGATLEISGNVDGPTWTRLSQSFCRPIEKERRKSVLKIDQKSDVQSAKYPQKSGYQRRSRTKQGIYVQSVRLKSNQTIIQLLGLLGQ